MIPNHGREDNIKTDVKEIVCNGVDRTVAFQVMGQRRYLVNIEINFAFHKREIFEQLSTISFSREEYIYIYIPICCFDVRCSEAIGKVKPIDN
jgi:hypothetical protein